MHSKISKRIGFRSQGLKFLTAFSALMAMVSCQSAAPSDPPAQGPQLVTATSPYSEASLTPDSLTFAVGNTPQQAVTSKDITATSFTGHFALPASTTDTISLGMWTFGMQTAVVKFTQTGSSPTLHLEGAVPNLVAKALLKEITEANQRNRDTLYARYARHLVNADTAFKGYPATRPVGIDTVALVKIALTYAVSKQIPLELLSKSWYLVIDAGTLHILIKELVAAGKIVATDTVKAFPPYPVRVKSPVTLANIAIGQAAIVHGAFVGDSGLTKFGWKVLQGSDDRSSGFKPGFSNVVDGSQTSWDLASDASFSLTAATAGVGSYSLVVWMVDGKGRSDTSRTTFQVVASVDTKAPTLTWVAPSGASQVLQNADSLFTVQVKAEDSSGIQSVTVNDSVATLAAGIYSRQVTVPVSAKGLLVTVKAIDKSGNAVVDTVRLVRNADTKGPTVAWLAPATAQVIDFADSLYLVKVTVSDPSGVGSVMLNDSLSIATDGVYSKSVLVPAGNQDFAITVRAVDKLGNVTTDFVKVYRTPKAVAGAPIATLKAPTSKTGTVMTFDSAYIVARWRIVDVVSGVDDTTVKIAGIKATKEADSNWSVRVAIPANGTPTVVGLDAKNKAGLPVSDFFTVTRQKDTVRPTVKQVLGSRSIGYDSATATLSWTVSDNDSLVSVMVGGVAATGVAGTYSIKVNLIQGANKIPLVATDRTGNQTFDTATVTRGGDQVKPVLLSVVGTRTVSFDTTSATVSWNVTDNDAVASVSIGGALVTGTGSVWSTKVGLVVGANKIGIVATDRSGNTSTDTAILTRSADVAKPAANLVSGSGSVSYDTTTSVLVWSVTDNDKVASVTINGSPVAGTGDLYSLRVNLVAGRNAFALVAKDPSGNTTVDSAVVTRGGDASKPVVVARPSNSTVNFDTTGITLSWTITDNGGVKWVKIAGITVAASGNVYSSRVPLNVGANSIAMSASDSAGNLIFDTVVVTRSNDAVLPSIVQGASTKSQSVPFDTKSISLSWTVSDNVAVDSIYYKGVGIPVVAVVSKTDTLVVGNNPFVLIAKDKAGNRTKDSINIVRGGDVTKPVILRGAGASSRSVAYDTAAATVSWTVSDNGTLSSVKINGVAASVSGGVYSKSIALNLGANQIIINALDAANNASADTVTITRRNDTVKAIVASDVNTTLRAGTFWVKLTCATPGAKIYYTLDGNVPTEQSTLFVDSIKIDSTRTLKARGFANPRVAGQVLTLAYNLAVPVAVSGGGSHTLVLMSDATLWGFGNNYRNAFSAADPVVLPTPIKIDSNVAQASAGATFSMWVKKNGELWGIGANDSGAFAQGNTISLTKPTLLMSGVSKVATLYEGSSFILMTTGNLYASGENAWGQLGVGSRGSFSSKKWVAANVVDMGGGQGHGYFVKSDGSYWSMGAPFNGRLGLPGDTAVTWPTKVMDTVAVIQPSNGQTQLVGRTSGSLYCFGWNVGGALGTGNMDDVLLPTKVNGISGRVQAIAAGGAQSLVLTDNGVLWGIGTNNYQQLGSSFAEVTTTPQILTTGVKSIGAGNITTLFIKQDNTLWGMGDNAYGELGQGETSATEALVRIRI